MTFQRPELLLLGPVLALLLSSALTLQWRRLVRLRGAYAEIAVQRLIPRTLQEFPTQRMLCLVVAGLALGVAVAGPRPPAPEEPDPTPPLDIAVAVDVSLSMSATDVGPSRIEQARLVVDRLAEDLPSARIVLVVFADWPYTLVPPTDDPSVVRYFARSLSADLVMDRDQGTSFSAAVTHARAALDARPRPGARRAILVLSDGGAHEDRARITDAVMAASEDDVPIWTAGLGTAAGASLVSADRPFVDATGRGVVATLDEELLRDIARIGGGDYQDVSGERGVRALLAGLRESDSSSETPDEGPFDAAFWLTFLAIPLLLWEGGLDAGRGSAHRPRGSAEA